MLKDVVECLWTGQGVEVRPGQNADEVTYLSTTDIDFVLNVRNIHKERGYHGGYQKLELRTHLLNPEKHELEFDVIYDDGDRVIMVGELTSKDQNSQSRDLKIFAKDPEGVRLVFEKRPSEHTRAHFKIMYDLLERSGYICQPVESAKQ